MIESILSFLSFDKHDQLIWSLSIIFIVIFSTVFLRLMRIPLPLVQFFALGLAMYAYMFSITDGEHISCFYKKLIQEQKKYNQFLKNPLIFDLVMLTKIKVKRQKMEFFFTFLNRQEHQKYASKTAEQFLKIHQKDLCQILFRENMQRYRKNNSFFDTNLKKAVFLFQPHKINTKFVLPPLHISMKDCNF